MARTYGKRFGERKEGRRLGSLRPSAKLSPYIMRRSSDACNTIADSLEVTAIEQWLLQKRSEGNPGMNLTHLIAAAYVRAVSMRPGVNRFVVGRRIYARSDIQIVIRIPRGVSDSSLWTSIKVRCSATDTVFDIYRRVNDAVDAIQSGTGETEYDRMAAKLIRLPRFALRFVVSLMRMADHYDWLPAKTLAASPFHGSLSLCDTGSLGIQPVSHHIYDFGNLPCFMSFGAKQRRYEYNRDGELIERHFVDYRISFDERVADAPYCAEALKCMKYFLRNPQLLELPPDTITDDEN